VPAPKISKGKGWIFQKPLVPDPLAGQAIGDSKTHAGAWLLERYDSIPDEKFVRSNTQL
jgi:hypothetical protein